MSGRKGVGGGSRKVVYAALAGNFLIAVTKFVAASITGSSAMLSEGVHSLVDTGNQALLLYGMHRATAPATAEHPMGHGREIYFWSFIVALLIFSLGAGVSIYEGIIHLLDPEPSESLLIAYVVLGSSLIFEGFSWFVALREVGAAKGSLGYFEAVRRSKDPTTFTVLFEDTAALLGLLIALVGITAAHLLDMPELDGIASIGIGLVLAIAAILLARETKGLLIGEAAFPHVQAAVLRIAGEDAAVHRANGVITLQFGPREVFAALSAEFEDGLSTQQIEACVKRLEARIKAAHPEVAVLFIKPQTAANWRARIDTPDPEGGPPGVDAQAR